MVGKKFTKEEQRAAKEAITLAQGLLAEKADTDRTYTNRAFYGRHGSLNDKRIYLDRRGFVQALRDAEIPFSVYNADFFEKISEEAQDPITKLYNEFLERPSTPKHIKAKDKAGHVLATLSLNDLLCGLKSTVSTWVAGLP